MKIHTILLCLLGCLLAASVNPVQAQALERDSTVEISIRGVPQGEQAQINGVYTISNEGYITMPFIGSIKAAGLSKGALEKSIARAYQSAQIYNNPTIVVIYDNVDKAGKQQIINVGGFVARPGPVSYRNGMTLFDVIIAAGGRNTFGSRKVKLYRGDKVQQYNLSNNKHKLIKVYPGDTVEVPQIGMFEPRD